MYSVCNCTYNSCSFNLQVQDELSLGEWGSTCASGGTCALPLPLVVAMVAVVVAVVTGALRPQPTCTSAMSQQ